MTTEQRSTILTLQATLTKIAVKQPVFFNLVQFRDQLGLVKEHGKREEFVNGARRIVTNWVLTEKGNQIMNIQL